MDQFHNILLQCSTKTIFEGSNLVTTWNKEKEIWRNTTRSSNYKYPELSDPKLDTEKASKLRKPNICQDLYWAADGTSIVAVNSDYGIRQYLIPENSSDQHFNQQMVPFTRFFRFSSTVSSAVNPKYSLFNNTDTNIILLSSKDLPLQAYSLNDELDSTSTKPLLSYNVTNDKNEKYETAYSIKFISQKQFLTGSIKNKISLYDASYKEPIWTSRLTNRIIGKSSHKSIVSCFSEYPFLDNTRSVFHFGTYKNEIGLIDTRSEQINIKYRSKEGNGVYQILMSENEHYLYSIKRNSNSIDILDTRMNCSIINELRLPFTTDNQKMKGNICSQNGMLLGSLNGNLIQWGKDMIEFGGIMSRNIDELPGPEFTQHLTDYNDLRINLVVSNPIETDQLAISYSPDKFKGNGENSANTQKHFSSGISLYNCS
ncbi:hypothetical protein TPHA_0F02370 [Tetrapisispora phaffii CBS 4417]|uniref:Protein SWT21 n=1 Tax=Tetrapisispora phaffii (strain ATCC 24235 / CBS 4417 / NBRC 1672 / NRRL Y-8282 / UCD 70-5) TaxID=1071381 RepID=G8BUD2_TETPH|nr:hypothetical protein TPHA_0F02370 [Tetrapisispora phaffii CBS 4417]CCE63718.1 hypothetical protein TPHA_0F02370 [Tetrapisispora phaffii CBS 4417]